MAKIETMLDGHTIDRIKTKFGTTEDKGEPQIVRPIHDAVEEDYGEIINPSDLSDEELREEIEARLATICNINMQLSGDEKSGLTKGDIWRIRAAGAIRHIEAEIRQLQDVQKIRLTLAEQKVFHERALAAKREIARQANEAQDTQNHLFVQWARATMGEDEFARAWDQTRAMFPDNPAWGSVRAVVTPAVARTIRSQYQAGVRDFTKLQQTAG